MSFFKRKQEIKAQIIDMERMLDLVKNHPVMSINFKERLEDLNEQLSDFPENIREPKVRLLFSGNAVKGSEGIKTSFLSKTLNPFQNLVKTQASLVRFRSTNSRIPLRKRANTDLYLTALPTGSFGVELSQLESNDLFAEQEVAEAMSNTIKLIQAAAEGDEQYEIASESLPQNTLTSLKTFLSEVAKENSVLKMESGDLYIQINEDEVKAAFERVDSAENTEEDEILEGVLRGILLDSGRFEMIDLNSKSISGYINSELNEDDIIKLSNDFLGQQSKIHLRINTTYHKTGKTNIRYELLDIKPL